MKDIVIYCKSNPNENIDIQVDSLVEYARNNKLNITKMYLDEGYLPFDYHRHYLKVLLHEIDLKLLDTIIVTSLKVFGMDISKLIYYINYIKEHNIRLISINDNFDNEKIDDAYYYFNEIREALYGNNTNN